MRTWIYVAQEFVVHARRNRVKRMTMLTLHFDGSFDEETLKEQFFALRAPIFLKTRGAHIFS